MERASSAGISACVHSLAQTTHHTGCPWVDPRKRACEACARWCILHDSSDKNHSVQMTHRYAGSHAENPSKSLPLAEAAAKRPQRRATERLLECLHRGLFMLFYFKKLGLKESTKFSHFLQTLPQYIQLLGIKVFHSAMQAQ